MSSWALKNAERKALTERATLLATVRRRGRQEVLANVGPRGERDCEDRGDDKVHGCAKWRPPSRAGDKLCAVLPKVFEAVARESGDQEPGWSGDGGGGDNDEDRCDGGLGCDELPASVGHAEPDVDGSDEDQSEGVDRGRRQLPEGELRGSLGHTDSRPSDQRHT